MSDRRGTSETELSDKFEVRVTAHPEAMDELFRRFPVDVGCRHPHAECNEDGSLTVLVYANQELIEAIDAAGFALKRGENVSAIGRERQAEIGMGDRFEGGRTYPKGLGRLDDNRPGRTTS